MTLYLAVPLLIVVGVVQATIVPHLTLWGVFADLPVLIVASWGLLQGARDGIVWGFVAGLVVDLLSGAPFGAGTFALMAAGFVSGLGEATVFRTHIALPLVAMFLATLIYNLVFMLILQIMGKPVAWFESLWRIVLPSAVLNTLLMPLVYGTLRLLHRRFVITEMEF
ncbi:MAG: rod shape-determining protein MreD [Anaerolineae bacterium]